MDTKYGVEQHDHHRPPRLPALFGVEFVVHVALLTRSAYTSERVKKTSEEHGGSKVQGLRSKSSGE